ncbi:MULTISPECIES: CRISPR-associated helicase Cas3' [unclassified Nonomuraea]|uniref:CRISPR-associated helicase Cas3' n=1 Tax=unclassified Nonomuraea TaxID=2593643 RepID=UPI0033F086AA
MLDEGATHAQFIEGLSAVACTVWAKHDRDTDGWLPLWRHLADSGAVAGLLWDRWLPLQVKRVIAEGLPAGLKDGRRLAVWLAATHDIGKASPAFACQVESLADAMRAAGLDMPPHKELLDRKLGPHGLVGQILMQEWLVERYGWSRLDTLQVGIVAGGHHGVPPTSSDIAALTAHPDLMRTPGSASLWRDVQWELLGHCARACGVSDALAGWRKIRLSQPAQALLTGLVIVADWIASNPDLFPYFPDAEHVSDRDRVESAWRGLDLPEPWQASEPVGSPEGLFSSRFRLPVGSRIRPVQERAVQVARGMSIPGLLVIEAPMGEGKTEAALAVAEIFAARSGAGGCFVALPTMATGNAMFPRMLQWLKKVPDVRLEPGRRSVLLAHSKAALNDDYVALMRAGRRDVRGVEMDGGAGEWRPGRDRSVASAELVAHQWLRGRKKGMLSSFVVGTIDQLLFMGLKSRHLALRHLAVAGKVVVIDEAHAYDTYMNSYLDRVLSWLGAYRVPVVVLSATLPAARRRELAEAYAGKTAAGVDLTAVEEARRYPLLTTVEPGSTVVVPKAVAASGRKICVHVERLPDDLAALGKQLALELEGGGCVLVVRNTVGRVLETAAYLRGLFGNESVSVAHARFVDIDRADKDDDLLRRFGPPEKSHEYRPVGRHIVVASSVAEQSLDIDFDLLVSDLCPVDLLLQRMGRLHRHVRGQEQSDRPERLRTARCLLTGADWDAVPAKPVRGSTSIYRNHALLRSAAVLEPYLSGTAESGHVVRLPEDISPLVQVAYGIDPVGPEEWQEAMARAAASDQLHQARQEEAAQDFQINDVGRAGRPLLGWIDAGVGDADDTRRGRAQVRDSPETLEVLVVQQRFDGVWVTLPDLSKNRGGLELPTDAVPQPSLARIVAGCGLRLPYHFSDPAVLERAIDELEANYVPAWQIKESYWLAGELILVLDENCRARLAGYDLRYTSTDGLEVTRAE